MIDQLITALNQEMDLSAEDIADTIWLALQINPSQSKLTNSQPSKDDTRQKSLNKEKFNQENVDSVDRQKSQTLEEEQSDTNKPADSQKAVISPRNLQQTSKTSELPFKVPNAPSLREPLTLARALKPLMRRLPSGTNLVLDEVATTQRIADEGLWLPVLKPMREPWLDLELVVDESISMQIWRRTIRELERLLKNYGIFRDVRVWGLISDESEDKEEVKLNKHSENSVIATKGKSSQISNSVSPQIQIRRGLGATAKNKFPRSPKELIDPTNRRLVLVVSDCVSSFWGKDEIRKTLDLWSNHLPLAIVQMLPQWLWERTALGRESEVRLQGLTAGIANQYLIHKEVSLWEELEEEKPIKVPIFTLESTSVATWAQMLSGKGNIWTLGYVFERDISQRKTGVFKSSSGELTAEQRVQRFRVTASPMARKLAGLLSASPVISLPVVRLIQETMLKDSLQVNVAEVFLGGLLKLLSEINAQTNPDYMLYEFWDGVRNFLVDSVPSTYVLTILDKVSEYVAKKAGLSLEEFTAVLKQEKVVNDSHVIESIDYFATVTAQVLRRLGGEYAEFADKLERDNQADYQTDIQTDLDSRSDVKYHLGGSLPLNSSSYIQRQADEELYNALLKGQFCYLFAPRQMGKTSLMNQVSQRLKKQGFAFAWIDLSSIGQGTQEQFFYSLGYMIVQEFELRQNWQSWYEERKQLSASILVAEFIEEILLKEISQPMIIFIDEIDYILQFDFASDFFSLLRALYQRISLSGKREDNKDYNPLTFVLSGVGLNYDLVPNLNNSPLMNIAVPIQLKGFTYKEALPLAAGLREKTNNPQQLLKSILQWTGGQPFLTQKLCQLVAESEYFTPEDSHSQTLSLEQLVQTQIIDDWKLQDNPEHLKTIYSLILTREKAIELLKVYQFILQNEDNKIDKIADREETVQELMLIGLVVRIHGKLRVANLIYAKIFTQKWVEQEIEKISREFVDSKQLYRTLVELGYRQQVRLFKRLIKSVKMAALLIYGSPDYGQRWLLNVLLTKYLPEHDASTVVKIDSSPRVRPTIKLPILTRELARYFNVPGQASLEEIASKIEQALLTRNVIIILNDVNYIGGENVRELLEDFWQPLLAEIQKRGKKNLKSMFLFMIDYEGKSEEITELFQEKANQLKLPRLREFTEADLLTWASDERYNLPEELVEKIDEQVEEIINNSKGGVPELVLHEICAICGYNWFRESEKWLRY